MDINSLKQMLCEIGRRIYHRGYVAANDGNISARINENEILITPSGVSKGFMTPDMMIRMDLNGRIIEGNLKPSSESGMHLEIYRSRENVGGVVHAHPPYATAFAVCNRPLDKPIMTEAVVALGTVPVAKYSTPSTPEVAASVKEFVADHNALLLQNHGALTWGRDTMQAHFRMETLEFYAQIMLLTGNLGGPREISPANVERLLELRRQSGLE